MTRKIRNSALAVLALLVLFATSAAPASAEEFHAASKHTSWTASQVGEDVYGFNYGKMTCSARNYVGTSSTATSTTISLVPSFTGCKEFASYDINGCEYQYHTQKTGVSTRGLSIVCPEGKSIVLTTVTCWITIPPQSGLTSVTYADEGTGKTRDIKITHSITGLDYTQTLKSINGCKSGSYTDGTYSGTTTLKATNTASEQIGVSVAPLSPEHDEETEHKVETEEHNAETAEHEAETDLLTSGVEFHSEEPHVLWEASQVGADAYTFEGGTWKCSKINYSGTSTTATSTTIDLAPSFAECTTNTTIDVNGCSYRYHTEKEGVSSKGMSIVCPEGKAIVITSTTCELTIPPQSGLTSIAYTTEGAGKTEDVKISHSISGLDYAQTPLAFPGCTKGSFTNGTYSGTTTLKATNTAKEQIGVNAGPKGQFHSEAPHTLWVGGQVGEDVFTFNAGTFKCMDMSYSGTSGASTNGTRSFSPVFLQCVAFGFVAVPFDNNGCKYDYNTGKEEVKTGSLGIVCPAGNEMIVTGQYCHVKIPPQSLSGVTYANEGAGKTRDIKITHSITGIKYTQAWKNFPLCTNGSFANGTYKGTTTMVGYDTEGEQIGVWVE